MRTKYICTDINNNKKTSIQRNMAVRDASKVHHFPGNCVSGKESKSTVSGLDPFAG